MAQVSQLPCDGDGICMRCKKKPSEEETLTCKTCVTPWHVNCLSSPPETLASTLQWECPDCTPVSGDDPVSASVGVSVTSGNNAGDLIAKIRMIEADESLTEQEKAKKRQEVMSGRAESSSDLDDDNKKEKKNGETNVLKLLGDNFKCSCCLQLPERPVTTPCGHNFCLKCFQKWAGQGKTCPTCREGIPSKMRSQPRINSSLVMAIRMAKMSNSITSGAQMKVYHFVHNENRPDKAYTTERAKKTGKANACSGRIFVTVPPDHFGPILAENDPVRMQGVLVGECWEDRMECRQWGAHLPHIAGIAGQSDYGAQSVALSGGYEDDEDHGEWFLYTGSGGRDLSGNKRTNREQSFDQKFVNMNEALRVSCKKGYPVRVVRSHKEKRSSYAPEKGVRYDGIYRIEKCWRKVGVQGFKVCRYLFVRCDNEPAPWTSDENGDRPRPLPQIPELKDATDITERKEKPSWDYDEEDNSWKWKKPSPLSRKKAVDSANPEDRKMAREAIRKKQNLTVRERLLKEFCCLICRKVMTLPLTTPCAHNFCKHCLEGAFAGQTFVQERSAGTRTLRARKNIMKCPSCPTDISDFLKNPQVNREVMAVIEHLQKKAEEEAEEDPEGEDAVAEENEDIVEGSHEEASEDVVDNSEGVEQGKSACLHKRRKVDSAKDSKEAETEEKKRAAVDGQAEDMEVEGTEVNSTPELQKSKGEDCKFKKEGGIGSMSNISEDRNSGEGNDSPSSPLHVRSDGDDM